MSNYIGYHRIDNVRDKYCLNTMYKLQKYPELKICPKCEATRLHYHHHNYEQTYQLICSKCNYIFCM